MDTNMTFRMDSQVKEKMAEICANLGITPSAAFNMFANAFVRANGMPFAVEPDSTTASPVTRSQMLADANDILNDFDHDYKRMAE